MILSGTEKVKLYPSQVNANCMVSICIQTYQQVDFIRQCIESVISQKTSFTMEILLGEDDSTDGTREICIEYAKLYPKLIRLFLHDRSNVIYINGKPTGRYNYIYNLSNANGKYIAICEGDDYWTDSYKLQKQVDFLESNPKYSICFHKVKIWTSNGLKSDNITREVAETTDVKELVKGNYMHTLSVIYRNNGYPEWMLGLPIGDYPLHMYNAQFGKIKKLDDVMGVYRIHGNNYWVNLEHSERKRSTLKCLFKLHDKFTPEINLLLKNELRNGFFDLYKNNELNKELIKEYCEVFGKSGHASLIYMGITYKWYKKILKLNTLLNK